MPREVVHWHILESVSAALGRQGQEQLQALLTRQRPAALIGALAHDAPYYLNLGRDSFAEVAEDLHGREGQHTFAPLRELGARIGRQRSAAEREGLWAFLLGMISHFATDAGFHPMIFYFTGNYHHPDRSTRDLARTRHRAFETRLDSWWFTRHRPRQDRRIGPLLTDLNPSLAVISEWLSSCLHESGEQAGRSAAKWNTSIVQMARLQSLFLSPVAGNAARLLKAIMPGRIAAYEALFSSGRQHPAEFFDGNILYRNPVSGTEVRASLDEMAAQVSAYCLDIFMRLKPCIFELADVEAALSGVSGPSLDFGIAGAKPEDSRFYAGPDELNCT